ncbi:uncharacterized protein Z518_11051 [Rhinocladiella mackenziei CBS 650.93]|uniref:Rhinocladiella mackenziei CBS 650.93 unplaced genomic scaffold supercont1.11, whole genome shotgun sequence n=1 Tax=Rhinocladiella mackenziei CBS 650.93 TaxID=1442369 RepID=A0A0D2I1L9_9EURO|nr:uncharacterized protein Z518_11051 [Rhinocladiella mackenziei CBS 650.93]KIW99638.1 hypothetical protein Z518_11051 [Rhinocladiella mackenziei CBS 650.93]
MLTEEALEGALERRDAAIRKEFKNVDERFDRFERRIEQRFEKIDQRFEKVDERLGQFYTLLIAQSTNPRAAFSRDKILPIGITSPASPSQLLFPSVEQFPNTVIQFWNLHNPKRVNRLVYLCNFYNIRSDEIVGDYSPGTMLQDSSDSDQEGEASSTSKSQDDLSILRTAAIDHPFKALSCLASRLFLNFETISYNMGTISQIRDKRAEREAKGIKREALSEENSSKNDQRRERHKRLVTDNTINEESRRSETLPDAGRREVTLPLVVGGRPWTDVPDDEPQDPSTPSRKSFVKWASHSDSIEERRFIKDDPLYQSTPAAITTEADSELKRDKPIKGSAKEIKSPSQSSKGSTVPFSQTPAVIKEAAERRKRKEGSGRLK